MLKIAFIDSNHPVLHETLIKSGFQCDMLYSETIEKLKNCIHEYDGIIIRSRIKIDKAFIDKASKLKFIARAGAGMDSIDVQYAESKGIECINSPEGNKDAVAEHAIGMLLMLMNNLCRANMQSKSGEWIREANRGIELQGKTVGIIGYGNMGKAFSEKISSFGVTVLVHDKYVTGFSNDIIKEASMERIFSEADIFSVHVPLTFETNKLINKSFFEQFKKPVFFINTARGKIVETKDLIAAIEKGVVAGACLDVLEYEEGSFENLSVKSIPELHYLFSSEKIVLTPHIAGWTIESKIKIAKILAEKIIRNYAV